MPDCLRTVCVPDQHCLGVFAFVTLTSRRPPLSAAVKVVWCAARDLYSASQLPKKRAGRVTPSGRQEREPGGRDS
jgi:hypothetical protein